MYEDIFSPHAESLSVHLDGRVSVHGRTSFHGIEGHVTFKSFPAVKPFPAERALLGKVSRRERPGRV